MIERMFDMMQPGDHTAADFDDPEEFEAFEESARLAEIIRLTQLSCPGNTPQPKANGSGARPGTPRGPPGCHGGPNQPATITGHEQVAVLGPSNVKHHTTKPDIPGHSRNRHHDGRRIQRRRSQIHAATAEIRAAYG